MYQMDDDFLMCELYNEFANVYNRCEWAWVDL
jgi:hypothetical protein